MAVLAAGLLLVAAAAHGFEAAPLLETGPDVPAGAGWRAFGPFLQELPEPAPGPVRETAFFRPLYTSYTGEADDFGARGWEVVWPFAFGRHQDAGSYQWVTPFLHTRLNDADPASRERWWLLPLWFNGRDSAGQPYWALFPVGGTIGDWLGFDHVTFWLFPVYVATDKGGVKSSCWLWPIFGQSQGGNQVDRWRVFPFYVRSQDARQKQTHVVWPFWHQAERFPDPRTGRRGESWMLFPLCGADHQYDKTGREVSHSWTVLWPFFSGGDAEKVHYFRCPWPFYRTADADTSFGRERSFHVWPFYGSMQSPGREVNYALWPVIHWWQVPEKKQQRHYTGVMPFFWKETVRTETGAPVAWHHQVWPLWRYEHGPEAQRLRVLALWPAGGPAVVYRNWAPLWTVYNWDRRDGVAGHDLLWGLAQYRGDPERTRKCSLFPLFSYRADPGGYELQLLTGLAGWGRQGGQGTGRALWFFRWGGPAAVPAPAAASAPHP